MATTHLSTIQWDLVQPISFMKPLSHTPELKGNTIILEHDDVDIYR